MPFATCRLWIARHGETLWNVEGRLQGHCDSPLTERGRAQAAALAARLAEVDLAALYASDLGRALETAGIVASVTGLVCRTDPRLRERALGPLEGMTREECQRVHPDVWAAHRAHAPDYVLPGGESARERYEKTASVLEEIAERHAGAQVAVISHGGPLNSAFRLATGLPLETPRRFKILNAGLNVLEYADRRWTLVSWGDAAHLGPALGLDEIDRTAP